MALYVIITEKVYCLKFRGGGGIFVKINLIKPLKDSMPLVIFYKYWTTGKTV